MARQTKNEMPKPSSTVEVEESLVEEVTEEEVKEALPPAKKVEPNKPIAVVALRAGFYGGYRKKEGDKFFIEGPHKLGSWMKKI